MGVAGRGTNTNIYTGNTVDGRGAAAYNPTTGVVTGAGAGYAGNIYTGQGAAGRGSLGVLSSGNGCHRLFRVCVLFARSTRHRLAQDHRRN